MFVFYTRTPRPFADLDVAHGDVCCVRYAVRNHCYLRETDDRSRRLAIVAGSLVNVAKGCNSR